MFKMSHLATTNAMDLSNVRIPESELHKYPVSFAYRYFDVISTFWPGRANTSAKVYFPYVFVFQLHVACGDYQ